MDLNAAEWIALDLDATEWIALAGTIGTFLAAVVPLIFFLFERRDRKQAEARQAAAEEARDLAEQAHRNEELRLLKLSGTRDTEERQRSQADLVHVWLERNEDDHYIVFFSNTSLAPVTNVSVIVDTEEPGVVMETKDLRAIRTLPPTGGTPMQRPLPVLFWPTGPVPSIFGLIDTTVSVKSVFFTDADGRHWVRDQSGRMIRDRRPRPSKA